MIYINPRKDFDDEGKIAIKIQIDNSLDLGWKKEDILLVTNFDYEYNSIKAVTISDSTYCDFSPSGSTKISVIVNLFELGLIDEDTLYWAHDLDAYQMEIIKESELDLGKADIGLTDKGIKPRWNMGSIFFKSSAKDIFWWAKEIVYKYHDSRTHEEFAMMAVTTNNLLWITETESDAKARFVPMNIPGAENVHERVKKLNISYCFWPGTLRETYEMATKPIRVVHFHFSEDLFLDSFMYGKNSLKMVIGTERLIKIFKKHGVKGVALKKMKNLMICLNPEKKFPDKSEDLVKIQIDNSLELGWKKEDILIVTNFPYEYQGIKSTVLDDSIFNNINDKASNSNVIFNLLTQEVVKEGELWWFHNLDVFQVHPIDSSQIDLEDTTAGFTDNGTNKLYTGSFFFRKASDKTFEWMRNRARNFRGDESAALDSLVNENYRNINTMYKRLNFTLPFTEKYLNPVKIMPKRLIKIFNQHGIK